MVKLKRNPVTQFLPRTQLRSEHKYILLHITRIFSSGIHLSYISRPFVGSLETWLEALLH